jgi:polyhydroxybutyrate depolymerase
VRRLLLVSLFAAGCSGSDDNSVGAGPPADAPIGGLIDGSTEPVDALAPADTDAIAADTPDAALDPVDAGPDPAPGCAAPAWPPGGDATVTVRFGDVDRSYVVHVGAAVRADRPAPLLVNFHGHRNSPAIQALFSQMNPLSDTAGFIVVYPQGIAASFNGGGCCGDAAEQGLDDVGFTRALVADVVGKLCIDRGRIYAAGFSNGGFMAHRLACEASDLFAAVAPVSAGNAAPACTPPRPVPVIAFHGDIDTVIRYASGESAARGWATRNGCTGEPTRVAFGRSYCDRWTTCAGGVAVEFCTDVGGWHLWPSASRALPASPAIWEFLMRYTLP